ncbi:hypothetical protein R1flu_014383 [Riccia fluitans]|uniref:Uncharacterized protein n=1 Tax=Riccia fluitans TaxID=41844 RepID=A0ABD1YJ33_9MARC
MEVQHAAQIYRLLKEMEGESLEEYERLKRMMLAESLGQWLKYKESKKFYRRPPPGPRRWSVGTTPPRSEQGLDVFSYQKTGLGSDTGMDAYDLPARKPPKEGGYQSCPTGDLHHRRVDEGVKGCDSKTFGFSISVNYHEEQKVAKVIPEEEVCIISFYTKAVEAVIRRIVLPVSRFVGKWNRPESQNEKFLQRIGHLASCRDLSWRILANHKQKKLRNLKNHKQKKPRNLKNRKKFRKGLSTLTFSTSLIIKATKICGYLLSREVKEPEPKDEAKREEEPLPPLPFFGQAPVGTDWQINNDAVQYQLELLPNRPGWVKAEWRENKEYLHLNLPTMLNMQISSVAQLKLREKLQ